jgi:hypothetical protein
MDILYGWLDQRQHGGLRCVLRGRWIGRKLQYMRRYSHLSGGTDCDPKGEATLKRKGGVEKSHTHRHTDGMLDVPKGTGR